MRCFVLVGLRDLFFFQAEDGIRDIGVTGVQTCALPILPLWTLPVAIGAGNAYILKPSERTPLSAVRLGELLTEAGLPDGVFNIDRKSVVEGKSVDLGGRRMIKKKK